MIHVIIVIHFKHCLPDILQMLYFLRSDDPLQETTYAENMKHTDFKYMCQGLSLCIIYGANLGGISTLPGTATNLILKGLVDKLVKLYNYIYSEFF